MKTQRNYDDNQTQKPLGCLDNAKWAAFILVMILAAIVRSKFFRFLAAVAVITFIAYYVWITFIK